MCIRDRLMQCAQYVQITNMPFVFFFFFTSTILSTSYLAFLGTPCLLILRTVFFSLLSVILLTCSLQSSRLCTIRSLIPSLLYSLCISSCTYDLFCLTPIAYFPESLYLDCFLHLCAHYGIRLYYSCIRYN